MADAETQLAKVATVQLRPLRSVSNLLKAEKQVVHLHELVIKWLRDHLLFVVVVAIPVTIASLYFGFVAADQYVSEARYIVRSASSSSTINALGSLNALSTVQTMSRAADDTNAVNDYLQSRDLVAVLERQNHLRRILSRPEADFIARFPNIYSKDDTENLYKHFQHFIDVSIEGGTGIGIIRASAFRPRDSLDLANAMLDHAERLVNKLNVRARRDAIQFATSVVNDAERRVSIAQQQITAFRNQEMVIDPDKQAAAVLDLIYRLTGDLADKRAALIKQRQPRHIAHK